MKTVLTFLVVTLVAAFTSIAYAEGGNSDTRFSPLNGLYEILNPKSTEPMCKLDGQQCQSFAECCTNLCVVGICGNGGH